MSENDKKESKFVAFFKKIGITILNWFKSGFKWICIAVISVASIILFRKIDHAVQINDEKKKQNAKDDAVKTKSDIEKAETEVESIKSDIEKVKEEISNDKETLKNSKKEYKEKQKETAEEAGFIKDKR